MIRRALRRWLIGQIDELLAELELERQSDVRPDITGEMGWINHG